MGKTLGFLCLAHFLYRLSCGGVDAGFEADGLTLLGMLLHLALSCTSLVFNLPAKRTGNQYRIWPEYRLHSIIFACRSLAIMGLLWWNRYVDGGLSNCVYSLLAVGIGFVTLVAADIASWSVGENHVSSVRSTNASELLRFCMSALQF